MTIEHMADRLAELYGAAAVRGPVVATAPAGP
jgi:hypothetical protein